MTDSNKNAQTMSSAQPSGSQKATANKSPSKTAIASASASKGGALKSSSSTKDDGSSKINGEQTAVNEGHPGVSKVTTATIGGVIGDENAARIFANREDLKKRQHLLDPTRYRFEYKESNPNVIPNNLDPYPVDLKIEELETHLPRVKIHEWDTQNEGIEATEAALAVAHAAERRIVKLENLLSTVYRYLFRLGTRVNINCVYYGGQTPFEKYAGIRCLNDNRVSDGKIVQIDQCLNCTRYEPVLGQCYEIINDIGVNVATLLDDNQMGYSNMEEYMCLNRLEKMHKEKDNEEFDLFSVETDPDDPQLDDSWGDIYRMDWTLVPVEQQVPHINWRQSILDDGSKLMRLASFTGEGVPGIDMNGPGGDGDGFVAIIKKNKEGLDKLSGKDNTIKSIVENGKAAERNVDICLDLIKGDKGQKAVSKVTQTNSLFICALAHVMEKDPSTVGKEYDAMSSKLNIKNPAIVVAGMELGADAILGNEGKKIPRLDKVLTNKQKVKDSDVSSSDGKNKTTMGGAAKNMGSTNNGDTEIGVGSFRWEDVETVLYSEILDALIIQAKNLGGVNAKVLSIFPRAVYLFLVVLPKCQYSRYDHDEWGFPFIEEQLPSVWYTSPYGFRQSTNSMHRGIDLGCDRGTKIHAVHDGIVHIDGWGADWNAINIQHTDKSTYSRYLHCNKILVKNGQSVNKGDIIGEVGGYGPNGPNSYPDHLHLEICHGNCDVDKSGEDPLTYFAEAKKALQLDKPCA